MSIDITGPVCFILGVLARPRLGAARCEYFIYRRICRQPRRTALKAAVKEFFAYPRFAILPK